MLDLYLLFNYFQKPWDRGEEQETKVQSVGILVVRNGDLSYAQVPRQVILSNL